MTSISTGFQSQNKNYDLSVFSDLAALSAAAYSTGTDLVEKLNRVGWALDDEAKATIRWIGLKTLDAHAFAAVNYVGDKRVMAISFEGTAGYADLLTDGRLWGFNDYYKSIRNSVVSWVREAFLGNYEHVYFTGHSLGGAAAQIALLDLLESSDKAIWTQAIDPGDSDYSPLGVGDRSDLTSEERQWLLTHVSGATFGAPSISADPPGILTTDFYLINQEINLDKYKNILFQFEHKAQGALDDPIAAIGSSNTDRGDELGTLVAIDLPVQLNNRYLGFSGVLSASSGLYLHAMAAYQESIVRALSNNQVSIPDDASEYAGSLLQLPVVSGFVGTSGNELMYSSTAGTIRAGDGNDIIVVQRPNSAAIDGGAGSDAYIIKSFGVQITIDPSVTEKTDNLYLMGSHLNLSAEYGDQDELVISVDGKDSGTSIRINNWFSGSHNYQLSGMYMVTASDLNLWRQTIIDFGGIGVPLFREGTWGDDTVIGSNLEADTISGSLGSDKIYGRGGNDLIYGDIRPLEHTEGDGNDEISGGSGSDTIYGEGGDDFIDGDEGVDLIYGGRGSDTMIASDAGDLLYGQQGNDLYAINANSNTYQEFSVEDTEGIDSIFITNSAADYSHTLYAARSSGNLDIYIRNNLDQILTRVQVVGMDAAGKQIENIVISNGGDLRGTASLVSIWNMASVRDVNGNPVPSTVSYNGVESDRRYGTENADSLVGTSGNDSISGYGGNDTIRGLAGNDRIWGGAGNDEIWGGDGIDIIGAGDGDDIIEINGGMGNDFIDGGSGIDTVEIDASNIGGAQLELAALDASGALISHIGYTASYQQVADALAASAQRIGYGWWDINSNGLTLQNVENVFGMVGTNEQGIDWAWRADDLIWAKGQTGGTYLGGTQRNYDTFYADWSGYSDTVTWVNKPAGDPRNIGPATVGGIERLLISTGSGNDLIDNTYDGNNTNDYIDGGSGNDTIKSGFGADTIKGGLGNDTIMVRGGQGEERVDGGTGTDTLVFDASNLGGAQLELAALDASGALISHIGYTASYQQVTDALAASAQRIGYGWWDINSYGLTLQNVENVFGMVGTNEQGIDWAWRADDLIWAKGQTGGTYLGGTQRNYDAFYADWSGYTGTVTWVNNPTGEAKNIGPATVGGIERLLISTGSGNDLIDNTYDGNNTNDYIDGGSGNDTIKSGFGADTIKGGLGNDTIMVRGGQGEELTDGGTGTDTLVFDASNLGGAQLELAALDASGALISHIGYTASYQQVTDALAASAQRIGYGWWDINSNGLTLQNVENVFGMVGTNEQGIDWAWRADDLIWAKGQTGGTYLGGTQRNYDTFYADWSGYTGTVTWINKPVGDNQNIGPATVGGIERLLISTGSGNDLVDNSYDGNNTSDYIDGGVGNDTIKSGFGADTIKGGLGNDTIMVRGGQGEERVDGGTGTDTLIFDASNLGGAQLELAALDASGALISHIGYTASYQQVADALAASAQRIGYGWWDINSNGLTLQNVENVFGMVGTNEQGIDWAWRADDLIWAKGQTGGTYLGGTQRNYDAFYADWSGYTGTVTWVNNPTGDAKNIGPATVGGIERLLISTGSGNDLVDNSYDGNNTNDYIDGGAGNDTVTGGAGNDTLLGSSGLDFALFSGNQADYTITVADGKTTVTDNNGADGNDGQDVLQGIEILTFKDKSVSSGSGDVTTPTLAGTSNADLLTGNSDSQLLFGLAGDDTLMGGAGNDTLDGGTGNDTYRLGRGDGQDTAVRTGGAFGDDTIHITGGLKESDLTLDRNGNDLLVTLTASGDTLRVTGQFASADTPTVSAIRFDDGSSLSAAQINTLTSVVSTKPSPGRDLLTGTAGADLLDALAGNDRILGKAGNDTLIGGLGADTLEGGIGNDLYVTDNPADVVIELANEGVDTVQSSVSWTLGANVEYLTLTGSAALNGTGNELANTLTGNASANRLDGGAGIDLMLGGAGDDTYVVDNAKDSANELANAGTDTVEASVSWTLGANLEHLTLTGSAALNATGNALPNRLTGNAAANVLDGRAGADTLFGGVGDDLYIVDVVGDVITELANEGRDTVQSALSWTLGANLEQLTLTGSAALNGAGNALANTLTGNSGANVLDGQAGTDTMLGGLGNDTYVVDNAGDVVTELANAGTDTVLASVTYTASVNVENLTLTGASAIDATGNALANTLTGNAGANRLDGGAGVDKMLGGLGDDTYIINVAGDVVTELANAGTDTIFSAVTYTAPANVEYLTLTGSAAINATGNTLTNSLVGNAGANRLDGGAGNDTLYGAAGADTMIGGLGNDTYFFQRGNGTDLIQDNDVTVGNKDLITFGPDINADQLWFRKVGTSLEVSIIGTADKATLDSWYLGSRHQIEQFQVASGQTLLSSTVDSLVSAMAAFAPPTAGQTTLPVNYQSSLNPVITVNWK